MGGSRIYVDVDLLSPYKTKLIAELKKKTDNVDICNHKCTNISKFNKIIYLYSDSNCSITCISIWSLVNLLWISCIIDDEFRWV